MIVVNWDKWDFGDNWDHRRRCPISPKPINTAQTIFFPTFPFNHSDFYYFCRGQKVP